MDHQEARDRIADLINRRRAALGVNKREAAELLGVSKPTYHAWEHGHWAIQPRHARRLADYLEVPIQEVMPLVVASWEDAVPPHTRVVTEDEEAVAIERRFLEAQEALEREETVRAARREREDRELAEAEELANRLLEWMSQGRDRTDRPA